MVCLNLTDMIKLQSQDRGTRKHASVLITKLLIIDKTD